MENDPNVFTLRIIKSQDDEYSHYYTVQINEWGCVQLQSQAFDNPNEILETFCMSPEDAIKVAESLLFIAREELNKENSEESF